MHSLHSLWWASLLAIILLAGKAHAFPPAPSFTYHGTVRDGFGQSIPSGADAYLVVLRGTTVISQAPIGDQFHVGENYRLQLPLDLDPASAYSATALSPSQQISFQVRFPSRTVPISSISTAATIIGSPAGVLRLDLTTGADGDNDGLPDDWEYDQLDLAGIGFSDPRYGLNAFSRDGDFNRNGLSDYDEYIAGTFAALNGSGLGLKVTHVDSDGFTHLELKASFGKHYRFQSSPDMLTWTDVPVCEPGDRTKLYAEIQASDDGTLTLETPPTPETQPNTNLFYRASVR